MTDTVTITKVNETYMRVHCSEGVLREMSAYFSFLIPNAKYNPKVRKGLWDGRIKLLKITDQLLYLGLKSDVADFCARNGYEFIDKVPKGAKTYTFEELDNFSLTLNLPHRAKDYQIQAIVDILNDDYRGIILSPTGSGKSLIIYILYRFLKQKLLLIVPTKGLVRQMASDFAEYGYEGEFSLLMSENGITPNKEKLEHVVISTWHSIYKMPSAWFSQFRVVVGDEAHTFTANSLVSIMEKATQTVVRVGTTGTLTNEDSKVNEMVLRGLFGRIFTTKTTRELIDSGDLTEVEITSVRLIYDDETKKEAAKLKRDYPDEMNWLYSNKKRQRFIIKLAGRLNGNTLILFKQIKHGKELHAMLKEAYPDKDVRLVYGNVKVSERDQVRTTMEENTNVIGVCSYATFATGTNIKNLHNIIFAAPLKGSIKVLQAIGRVIRLHSSKDTARLYDIGDDLTYKKQYKNHAWRHFAIRLEYYIKAKLKYKIVEVKL